MVSRILRSFSGMLTPNPAVDIKGNATQDVKNENEKIHGHDTSLDSRPVADAALTEDLLNQVNGSINLEWKKYSADDEEEEQTIDPEEPLIQLENDILEWNSFSNAGDLDRAIVHRLHSRLSVCNTNSQRPIPTGPAKLIASMKENNSNVPASKCEMKESCPGETCPMSRPKSAKPVSKMLPDLEALGSSGSERELSDVQTAGEYMRSVMFTNSKFNMETPSKEVLCSASDSDSNKPTGGALVDDIFRLPGCSAHQMYHRQLTSSTESIRGTDTNASRENSPDETISHPTTAGTSASTNPHISSFRLTSRSANTTAFTSKFASANFGERLFEGALNEIIEKGGDEFKNKYSAWVWDAFRAQLAKLKALLLSEFNHKMKSALDERELELTELQVQYREKLTEFDSTTDGFQKMIDNLYSENQRVLKAKDLVIDRLKKEFIECKRHFEHDLARQLQSYRKEAEVEKLELQKRNDELMMIMLSDASKCDLEEAFKREIQSLHKMIKALTTQNEVLHQQLGDATQSVSSMNKKTLESLNTQLQQAKSELRILRDKLQTSEVEKQDLNVAHHEQIAKLNRKIQESNTRYEHQLHDASEEIDSLRKKHSRETKDLKQKLISQENQHSQMINQVKQQYGGQVESLSKAVSKLQAELTVRGVGATASSPTRKF